MKKAPRFEVAAAVIVFVATLAVGVYRLFLGASVADEGLYVVLADFPRLGAKWFVDDVTIQTTSAILLSPFISLYTAIFEAEGVVLFSRLLYLLSATLTALVTAVFFSRYCRWPVALLFSACIVAYVPFGMACLNYNAMGSQYFGLATVLCILGLSENKPRWTAAGAVFWVLCVFAYPTAMITFFIFAALTLWAFRGKARAHLKPILLGLVIPSVLLSGVLLWCGPSNIAKAVEISNHFNMPFQSYKILFGLQLLGSYLPPWWMLGLVLAAWVALAILRPAYSYAGLVLFLLVYMFFGGQSESAFGSVLWTFTGALAVPVLAQHGRDLRTQEKYLVWSFLVPAIAGAIVAWMTSRMTVYNMHGTGIFAALGVSVIATRRSVLAGWTVALLLLAFTLKTQFAGPYEDAAYPQLTYRISSGPFRFLWTNINKGEAIETLQKDLSQLPQYGSILYKDHFPIGLLMSPHRGLGPTTNILPAFLHPEARPIYAALFQDRKYFPDYVVEFRRLQLGGEDWVYMDQDPENPTLDFFKADPFHNFFMKSGEYRVLLDRGVYRILRRNI